MQMKLRKSFGSKYAICIAILRSSKKAKRRILALLHRGFVVWCLHAYGF